MKKEYANEALMVCHQSAESLLRMGIIDTEEMKEFDEGCLVQESSPPTYEAEKPVVLEHVTAFR
jgi:DNA-binding transcriptional regulator YiaG